ncbi:hypothetical protein HAX54_005694 [Datura stramonium]|uniref:Uncharacterized protein n=1 Tax=Datura stramonium TaxID=4076 RepID=A0ABS8TBM8_DATST|nr:hypothetical protein [Datura stramonium]
MAPHLILPKILMKLITMLHGERYLKWSEAEVKTMNVIENLQHTVDHMRMDIEDEATEALKTIQVNIQYDYLSKYCKECKLQGHNINECWRVQPQTIVVKEEYLKENINPNKAESNRNGAKAESNMNGAKEIEYGYTTAGTFPRVLTSGKVVGNMGEWKEANKKDLAVKSNLHTTEHRAETSNDSWDKTKDNLVHNKVDGRFIPPGCNIHTERGDRDRIRGSKCPRETLGAAIVRSSLQAQLQ